MATSKLSAPHKSLVRRYLIWAYKTTRESFDRLERKTTQLMVDEFILNALIRNSKSSALYKGQVEDFEQYIENKKQMPIDQPQYLYLKDRLCAVEKAIKHYLGAAALKSIQRMYEQEFTRRIMEARQEH